jgi:hypothetical protein
VPVCGSGQMADVQVEAAAAVIFQPGDVWDIAGEGDHRGRASRFWSTFRLPPTGMKLLRRQVKPRDEDLPPPVGPTSAGDPGTARSLGSEPPPWMRLCVFQGLTFKAQTASSGCRLGR